MTSYADLIKPLARSGILSTFLTLLEGLKFPTTAWGPTDEPRGTLEAAAEILVDVSAMGAGIGRMGMLGTSAEDGAVGDALTLFAAEAYSEGRKPPVALVGTVTLTETAGTPHTYAAGELLFSSTADPSLVYRNVAGFTIGAGASLSISLTAESPGAKYNVQGSTLQLATPIPGVTLSAAPDSSWAGTAGADEESDEDLRARLPLKWATLTSTGPDAAYLKWVLDSSSSINRARVTSDPAAVYPSPAVTVTVAGPTGTVSPAVLVLADAAVQGSSTVARRALGHKVLVQSAGATSYTLKGDLTVRAGFRTAAEAAIAALLADYFSGKSVTVNGETVPGLQIGDTVRVSVLIELVMSVPGVVSFVPRDGVGAIRIPGTGDVAISATNVAVLTWSPTSWTEV